MAFLFSASRVADAENCVPGIETSIFAVLYESGEGLPQDLSMAIRLYRPNAERGEPYSQFKMGTFYEQGKGVKQSRSEAYFWYSLAAYRDKQYIANKKSAAKKISAEAVARVDKRVNDFIRRYYTPACLAIPTGKQSTNPHVVGENLKRLRYLAERGVFRAQRELTHELYQAQDYRDALFWGLIALRSPECRTSSCELIGLNTHYLTRAEIDAIQLKAKEWKPLSQGAR